MSLLKGKKALILGVANERSIAWAITQEFKKQGAQVALTYLNDALKKRVEPLSQEVGVDFLEEVDVTKDQHIENLKHTVQEKWGKFDILIHSLAFADKEDLKKPFSETSRAGFNMALEISAYSLVQLSGALKSLMNPEGSIISLTYYGAEKVSKNYNVMGVAKAALECSTRYLADDLGAEKIRVNCISAGPIKTLAASGISGFRSILQVVEEKSPLHENIATEDVAQTALYLASDMSKRVTGQVLYVDSGLSIMGF